MFNAESSSDHRLDGVKAVQQNLSTRRAKLEFATPADAAAIAALRVAASQRLAERHGQGPWAGVPTERGVLFMMRHSRVLVFRQRGEIIATLTLGTKKPWAIDRKYFSPCQRPVYLTAMAVSPARQGRGIGRRCVEEAVEAARQWPGDAILLDAYDAAAGAGGFYRQCGFREVGRAVYRGAPLVYFERLL